MKKFYLGIALTMALASCTQEELVNSTNESKLQVSVESNNTLSRVGFDKADNWSFFWHNGDEIWVNDGIMDTDASDKSKTATFTGYGVNTSTGYAVYPYAIAKRKVNGTEFTWDLPETYTYTDIDADFFESAQSIPMYAKVSNGNASFKHLGAIVAFKFNDWTLTGEHIFTLTSSKKITGEFTTNLASTNPGFETNTDKEDEVTITYNRPSNATETSIVFYVPVPTGTYDLYVELAVDGKTKFTKSSKNKTVNLGDIVWADIKPSSLQGDNKDVKEVRSIAQINDQILSTTKEDLTVQVTEEVTGNQTIEIPASLNSNTTTFMFDNVADDAVITINNATSGAYDGKVIIEVPVGETIPTVNANIPNGEVYIKQGTITTLIVSSKKNTTIIGAGVTVGTLTVNQGNVRVEKEGVINTIDNKTNGTLYITNAGGTLPKTLPDNTIVIYENTEHDVVLNGKYSADNITDLLGYGKDVLNTTELSFVLAAGQYKEVVKVTGGKNITFEPANVDDEVTIAGIDHQSNANPSTIVVKNITLDNTLQTEGWFTGTAPNIKPCVGAWGGNFTFEDCKFIVSGESKAETGVMTWWTTAPALSLTFTGCEFVGYNDHASARAMQIYGNVNMQVTDCTFNTKKDYSLKYVAKEGNVATFVGNKVYNSENFVQLGSAPYAGENYKVYINSTTLGEGVAHYYIDNDENQMVYIDGSLVVSTDEQLLSALTDATASEINILLTTDLSVDITAWETLAFGSSSTNLISIDCDNHKLTFNQLNSDWNNIATKNNAKLIIKNGQITNSGHNDGPWNRHDLNFACDVELVDITSDKAIALKAGGTLTRVTINDANTSDTYAVWIQPKGQTVTLNECTIDMINCTDGRGIKIDNQYLKEEEESKITLNISKTTFKTEEKSAILVKSNKGAIITLSELDITEVAADSTNPVWVDSATAASADLVVVTGGSKFIEK